MAAFKLPLTILQGETFAPAPYIWKAGTPAVPVDLTGATARMQVRSEVASADVLIELSTANGRITLGGTAGTVALSISATDTAAITWAQGVYDLEVTMPGGVVRRLLAGTVKVSPEVTRG